MRTALLLSLLVVTFGCKKASAPDPLDGGTSAIATTDAGGPEVEDLDATDQAGGGGAGKKGEGAAGASAGADGGESAAGGAGTSDGSDGGASGGSTADGGAAGSGGATADGGTSGGTTAGGSDTTKPADPNPTQPGAPYGNVEFSVTSVSGGTGGDALKAALDKNKQRFRGCYGKEPNNSGTLKMRITIASDGVVEKPEVMGGNLAPGSMLQCTVAAVKATKVAGATAPATKATFDVKYFK